MRTEKQHERAVRAGKAGAASKWSKAASRPRTVQVRVYESDAAALRLLATWPGLGRSAAETLRRLLELTEGSLWEQGPATPFSPAGTPRALPAFRRPPV